MIKRIKLDNQSIVEDRFCTSTVNRVLSNSRGYIVNVEQTPAVAPAIVDGGTGRDDGSPFVGVK